MNALGEYGNQQKIGDEWITGPFWESTLDKAIEFAIFCNDNDAKREKRAEIIKIIEVGK